MKNDIEDIGAGNYLKYLNDILKTQFQAPIIKEKEETKVIPKSEDEIGCSNKKIKELWNIIQADEEIYNRNKNGLFFHFDKIAERKIKELNISAIEAFSYCIANYSNIKRDYIMNMVRTKK
ncbi:MAG: hypothetical protein PHN88_02730 [Ignavibacteria bacterium]|nr:hypothetical protein [Ignavibacteria bacterium]